MSASDWVKNENLQPEESKRFEWVQKPSQSIGLNQPFPQF